MFNPIKKSRMLSLTMLIVIMVGVARSLEAQSIVEPRPGNGFVEPQNPHTPQFGGWYLGVYGTYTSSGLYLTQVYPGTAADFAGLEIGDRIVAVNNRRISLRYPLNLALQSTNSGWVRLSVIDWRTNRLLNVNVQLTRGRIHF